MTGYMIVIFVPIVIFMVIVAPLWLILYYSTRRREANTLSADHQTILNQMFASMDRMEARIGTLEKILDVEDPRWRDKGPVHDRL
jgi:phage shock protein B